MTSNKRVISTESHHAAPVPVLDAAKPSKRLKASDSRTQPG